MRMGPTATAECPIAFPGTCCCSPRQAHPLLHSPCAVASSPLQADDTPSVRETGAKQLFLSREVVTRKALVSHTPGATRLCKGTVRVARHTESPAKPGACMSRDAQPPGARVQGDPLASRSAPFRSGLCSPAKPPSVRLLR